MTQTLMKHSEQAGAILCRIWEELRKGSTPDTVAQEQDELLTGMQGAFHALDRLQKAADSFEVRLLMSYEYCDFIALEWLKILWRAAMGFDSGQFQMACAAVDCISRGGRPALFALQVCPMHVAHSEETARECRQARDC